MADTNPAESIPFPVHDAISLLRFAIDGFNLRRLETIMFILWQNNFLPATQVTQKIA